MATLTPEALDDLVELTYERQLQKRKWSDISMDLQDYHIADRFIKGKKQPLKGGPILQWKLQVTKTSNTRNIGLFSRDQYEVKNLFVGAQENWSIVNNNYSYDVMEPEFQGSDDILIVDEILAREHAMYGDWFEFLEQQFWTAPTSSTQDPRPLNGIPFWVQKNSNEGFNGGNPSGYADGAGGVNTDTYPNAKNYTGAYKSVTRDDLVSKWIKATNFCHFKPPHKYPSLHGETKEPDFMYYTVWDVLEGLQKYLDARNDNLRDIAGLAGDAMFQGVPVKWVPALTHSDSDAFDSQNPVYGVNWRVMKFYFNKGRDMVRSRVKKSDQHNVRVVHVDSACQLICTHRRSNFVLHVA